MVIVDDAIQACAAGQTAYCKFISANDAGATGAHQSGFYVASNAWGLLFDAPGERGGINERFVTINWHGYGETRSRFIWYGAKTRREYRITRFGRGFPFLTDEHIGSLLVLAKVSDDYYDAFVLDADEDIEAFLNAFSMSPTDTNAIIDRTQRNPATIVRAGISEYVESMPDVAFPDSTSVSRAARAISARAYIEGNPPRNPDATLLHWLDTEYDLFRAIEEEHYRPRLTEPFRTIEDLVACANTLLNRRKARAGMSLEHHLAEVFTLSGLRFGHQVVTEGNKRPDFIFPGATAYHDHAWPEGRLVFLGAKTTCKDRWRQILNEADRIPQKHLFTLQQGISGQQLDEMRRARVTLVVPRDYIRYFPPQHRADLVPLGDFIKRTAGMTAV